MKHAMKIADAVVGKVVLPRCSVILAAAGLSSRMEGVDKILADVSGQPMIVRAAAAFQAHPAVQEIVVVTRKDLKEPVEQLLAGMDKVTAVVVGGASRAESVQKGLNWCSKKSKLIAIHDAARPLVTERVIQDAFAAAAKTGAAAPAMPVRDTIRVVQNGLGVETPDRKCLYAIQTPQVFDADLIRAAILDAIVKKADITDDCSAVERMGMKVTITQGAEENLKVTTRLDLAVANALARKRDRA